MAMSLIQEYLQSVRAKFTDYAELMILDLDGRPIASSAAARVESSGESIRQVPSDTIKAIFLPG